MVMDIASGEAAPLDIAGGFTGLEWVGERELLVVRNVADSELRGTWLQSAGGRERNERILDQPAYERLDPRNPMPKVFLRGGKTVFQALGQTYLLEARSGTVTTLPIPPGKVMPIRTVRGEKRGESPAPPAGAMSL